MSDRSTRRRLVMAGLAVSVVGAGWSGCSDGPDRERVDAAIGSAASDPGALVQAVADEGVDGDQVEQVVALLPELLDALAEAAADGAEELDRADAVRFARQLLEADADAVVEAAAGWIDGRMAPLYLGDEPPFDYERDPVTEPMVPVLAVLGDGAGEGDPAFQGADLSSGGACRAPATLARELATEALVEDGRIEGGQALTAMVNDLTRILGQDLYAELSADCEDARQDGGGTWR